MKERQIDKKDCFLAATSFAAPLFLLVSCSEALHMVFIFYVSHNVKNHYVFGSQWCRKNIFLSVFKLLFSFQSTIDRYLTDQVRDPQGISCLFLSPVCFCPLWRRESGFRRVGHVGYEPLDTVKVGRPSSCVSVCVCVQICWEVFLSVHTVLSVVLCTDCKRLDFAERRQTLNHAGLSLRTNKCFQTAPMRISVALYYIMWLLQRMTVSVWPQWVAQWLTESSCGDTVDLQPQHVSSGYMSLLAKRTLTEGWDELNPWTQYSDYSVHIP